MLAACGRRPYPGAPQWTQVELPPSDPTYTYNIACLQGTAADDVWLGASADNLHFDGTSWVKVTNRTGRARAWRDVCAVSRTEAWAVGANGSVARFDGTAWTEEKLAGVDVDLLHVLAFPGGDVWVTAAGDDIHRYDGSTWTVLRPQALRGLALHNVWGPSAHDIYFCMSKGDGGLPLLGHFDGRDFRILSIGSQPGTIYSVHGTSSRDVWAVGTRAAGSRAGGQILHFDGERWTQIPIPVDESLWTVSASSPSRAWAAGRNGVILRWDGDQWALSPTGRTTSIGAVYAPPTGPIYAAETTHLLRTI